MSAGVDIRDEVTAALKGLSVALKQAPPAIGAAVVLLFQQHFASLPQNKNGWPSTGFWGRAARSTNYNLLADGVNINVTQQGVLQRLLGGHIRPTQGHKYLTIPAIAAAYGKRAGEFSNLHFGFAENRYGNLAPALIENWSQDVKFGRARKDGSRKVTPGAERGGSVFFWLVRSVYQQADPTVIPGEQQVREVCRLTVQGIVDRATRRQGGAA